MADDVRYGTIDHEYGVQLATTSPEDDGPVWMVNLMKYRDQADYADGRESDVTGREADDLYAPFGPLEAVGAEIVLVADVDTQFLNEDPMWDRVAVVRYPTRRSFIEMQALPEFVELHHHKDAGMEQTIVVGCQPFQGPVIPDDAIGWDEVPSPPTPDDGYVVVIHVLRFEDSGVGEDVGDGGGTPGEMDAYTQHASVISLANGVRIGGWFRAEGTIVGDGRSWDQVRFNVFPSKAGFLTVALDPDRLQAQAEHREVAIADTYTMILRPSVDRLTHPDLVAFALEASRG
jgi:hypothetical protein